MTTSGGAGSEAMTVEVTVAVTVTVALLAAAELEVVESPTSRRNWGLAAAFRAKANR